MPNAQSRSNEKQLSWTHLIEILNHDLDDHIAELDVHDGGHCFFLWSEESGSKTHTNIAHSH